MNAITRPLGTTYVAKQDDYSLAAHFVRGQWYYCHAKQEHAMPWPQSVFSAEELASPPFRNARKVYAATTAHRGSYTAASRLACR